MKMHARLVLICLFVLATASAHAHGGHSHGQGQGRFMHVQTIHDIPAGTKLREGLDSLSHEARDRAMEILREARFEQGDFELYRPTRRGNIYVVDLFDIPKKDVQQPKHETHKLSQLYPPVTTDGNMHLQSTTFQLHSRPASGNRIYLDFTGLNLTGSEWNLDVDGTGNAPTDLCWLPWNIEGDESTFSSNEQAVIRDVWERVAEDFAPFDVDVTTEPPTFDRYTMRVLFTPARDCNNRTVAGAANAGGVALLGVFGAADFHTTKSPAFVFTDNVLNQGSAMAEVASHEAGHNFNLNHDGFNGAAYHAGNGTGASSWGPIMGAAYQRYVSQWSNGDYALANNMQDDLDIIRAYLALNGTGYRTDDASNTVGGATAIPSSGLNFSTTGVIEQNTDIDYWAIPASPGNFNVTVTVFTESNTVMGGLDFSSYRTRGNNLAVYVELLYSNGTRVAASDNSTMDAVIQTTLSMTDTYVIAVRGRGDTWFSTYGSVGQYSLSGFRNDGSFIECPLISTQSEYNSTVMTSSCSGVVLNGSTCTISCVSGYLGNATTISCNSTGAWDAANTYPNCTLDPNPPEDDPTLIEEWTTGDKLYITIGAGAVILLLFVCCCCCRKNDRADRSEAYRQAKTIQMQNRRR